MLKLMQKNYSNHLRVYFCYSDWDVLYQKFSFWNDSVSPHSEQQLPVLPCALINIHVICFIGPAILYVSCLKTLLTQKYNITLNTCLFVGTVVRHLRQFISIYFHCCKKIQLWVGCDGLILFCPFVSSIKHQTNEVDVQNIWIRLGNNSS